MQGLCLLLFGVCFSASIQCGQGLLPFPGSLVGFWPFDSQSGTNDIAYNMQMNYIQDGTLMTSINGPFGLPGTSYSVASDNSFIAYRKNMPLPADFTVSFYFYTQATGNGGIFMFWNGGPRFSIGYREPNLLELWSGPESGKLIGRYPILTPNSWNFVAITYDRMGAETLRIHNKDGTILKLEFKMYVPTPDLSTVAYFGISNWGSGYARMKTTDALACLMIFNATLPGEKIRELPYGCLAKGDGTTRAIPSTVQTTKAPTVTTPLQTTRPPAPTTPHVPPPLPKSLIAYWPFDRESGTNDIGLRFAMSSTYNAKLTTSMNGPFGKPGTSYSVASDNSNIGYISEFPLPADFTISFYFYTQAKGNGGIFTFSNNHAAQSPRFAISYLQPNLLELWSGPESGSLIGRYPILTPNSWNYLAITYDRMGAETLRVHNQSGQILVFEFKRYVPTPDSTTSAFFGNANWGSGSAGMKTTDAIACLMIFNATLPGEEIAELPYHCELRK